MKAAAVAAPRGCTNLKLRQLSRRVTRHYDAIVSATGLKNTQYSLLSHVVVLGPIQLSALAAKMQLDPSTLTRNLQPLIAHGWLALEPGDDARSRRVIATPEGQALRTEAQRAWKRLLVPLLRVPSEEPWCRRPRPIRRDINVGTTVIRVRL